MDKEEHDEQETLLDLYKRALSMVPESGPRGEAAGITAHLKNGGTLEKAAAMANHASTRTTQLYDRRREEELTLDEVERIGI